MIMKGIIAPNIHIFRMLCLLVPFWAAGLSATASAQDTLAFGPHEPSVKAECGAYQWPLVQTPCPEVQIKQKHDHTPYKQYRAKGWDTVVDCSQQVLELSCMPYLPVQYFNGQYTVDTIPYDPPDPTFAQGVKMPVSTDDDFAADTTVIPFSFFFFGIKKDAFVLGANGLITFNTSAAGHYCPWKFSKPIPWSSQTTGVPASMGTTVAHMRDAIYGVYEDTHPIASYLSGDQGIYYGIQDEEPCRKIICSWNGIPTFPGVRNKNNRCTYQIVCYEGSNIIEVHIKRRGVNADWQGGRGLIGIQNATGVPQQKGTGGTKNVHPNSPAAYYPEGGNLLKDSLENIAFRFTPQGTTATNAHWYRIFDDGRDSVDLPQMSQSTDDTNGYFVPMGKVSPTCPTLTTAVVRPTCVSRYVFHLRFKDAADHWYNLYDTITIGVDTLRDLTLRPSKGTPADHQLDICRGSNASLILEYPELEDTAHVQFQVERLSRGEAIQLDDSLLVKGQLYNDVQTRLNRIPLTLRPDALARQLPDDKPDTVRLSLQVDFVSGCHNTVDILVITHPDYDTVDHQGICHGEQYVWPYNGNTYTTSTQQPTAVVPTTAGCDSVVHLDLTVYDVSHTIDERRDCKPLTWINGKTYTQDNDATAATDTVVLQNYWGCDSVVQLNFMIRPMEALIETSLDVFDYDHLDVQLTDVSTGGASRKWYLPTGDPRSEPTIYYTIPYEHDSALITMVEFSDFGCIDTARVVIPFRRDVIWVPNVFTPTETENQLFGSYSRHLLTAQTRIYNRFGQLVYRCDRVDCQWDGTDLNGRECPQGTYVYVIRYTTTYTPLKTETLKGTITLLK